MSKMVVHATYCHFIFFMSIETPKMFLLLKRYAVCDAKKMAICVRKAKIGQYAVRKGGGWCHPQSYQALAEIIRVQSYLRCVYKCKATATPNVDAIAFVGRSKNLSARCGVATKHALNIKFACYSLYTTSSQRPYSVHTTFLQRLYSVQLLQCLRRAHCAHTVLHVMHTAFSRRS